MAFIKIFHSGVGESLFLKIDGFLGTSQTFANGVHDKKGDFELDASRPLPAGTDKSEMNLHLKKRNKSGSASSRYSYF